MADTHVREELRGTVCAVSNIDNCCMSTSSGLAQYIEPCHCRLAAKLALQPAEAPAGAPAADGAGASAAAAVGTGGDAGAYAQAPQSQAQAPQPQEVLFPQDAPDMTPHSRVAVHMVSDHHTGLTTVGGTARCNQMLEGVHLPQKCTSDVCIVCIGAAGADTDA
jgi:hypothetical protein